MKLKKKNRGGEDTSPNQDEFNDTSFVEIGSQITTLQPGRTPDTGHRTDISLSAWVKKGSTTSSSGKGENRLFGINGKEI